MANTGCATCVVTVDAPLENIEPAKDGLDVNLPGGRLIRSTHPGHLMLPELPLAAQVALVCSKLKSKSLISIGKLCDAYCTAKFTKTKVFIC